MKPTCYTNANTYKKNFLTCVVPCLPTLLCRSGYAKAQQAGIIPLKSKLYYDETHMIDPITNTNEYNSLSTEQSELDEVKHVRFHLTFKINYIQMKNKDIFGFLNIDTSLYKTRISSKFKNRKPYQPGNPRIILSFIPGTVLGIMIKEGQYIKKGDDLMILDAMKMQNKLKCNMDGKVKTIAVKKGDKVSKGTVLLELE